MIGGIEHSRRFTIPDVGDEQFAQMRRVRDAVGIAAAVVDQNCPDGREKSLAWTKFEEAMFWANAGIARDGK